MSASASAAGVSSAAAVAAPLVPSAPPSEMEMDQVSEKLREFNDGFQSKALQIIYEIIPTKIEALQAILDKYEGKECAEPVFTPMGAQVNTSVSELMKEIKVEIHSLLSYIDPLRMWVSLNIPKIQDQKGVAVSVKEDLIEMLHSGKLSAIGLLESLTKYHVGRGKLISKMIKFPLSADHAVGIAELDKKQRFMMINMIRDLQNNYSLTYDLIIKNIDKLVKANDTDNYQNMY